jgi:hypothetical protein
MNVIKQQRMMSWQVTSTQTDDEAMPTQMQPNELWEQLSHGQRQVVFQSVVLACLSLIHTVPLYKEVLLHEQD